MPDPIEGTTEAFEVSESPGDPARRHRQLFGNSLYSEAEQVVRSGRVQDVRILQGGSVVTGIVSADAAEALRPAKFRVYIRNATAGMRGECSCGVRGVCVHVAAVSIAAVDAAQPTPVREQRHSAPVIPLGSATEQKLCYAIEKLLAEGRPVLQVSVWVAQLAGSVPDPATTCAFIPRGLEYPRYVDALDREILRTLTQQGSIGPWRLRGDIGAALLLQVVATGRAFRESPRRPLAGGGPLTRGMTRSLTSGWAVWPDGQQKPVWEGSGSLEVLSDLNPPLYIDRGSNQVGQLDLPCSDPVSQPLDSLTPRIVLSADEQAVVYYVYNGAPVEQSRLPERQTTVRIVSAGLIYEVPRDFDREALFQGQLGEVLPKAPDNRPTWLAFMMQGVPALQAVGWEVIVPAEFPYRIVAAQQWYGDLASDLQRSAWFNLRLGVVVDGQPVNLLGALTRYLQSSVAGAPAQTTADIDPAGCRVGDFWLVRLDDGRYLPVGMDRIQRIADTLVELFERSSLTAEEALPLPRSQGGRLAQLAMELSGSQLSCPDATLSHLIEGLKSFSGIRPVAPPAGFRGTLRPYQQEGLGWLQFLRQFQLGGALADDMGLGKTVQTIAHIALEIESGRLRQAVLIVAPVSALGNWNAEFARFAPGLAVHVWHGAGRRKALSGLRAAQVILTAYPLLLIDSELLLGQEYGLVILDEAQMIKNPDAKVSQAARALRAQNRLCLSGTPVENHLGELWSLFEFLQPGLLGSEREFLRLYRTPIEKNGDRARAQALSTRIAPFLLRRTKDAVARELPPKVEIIESITLDERQRDFYDGVRLAMHRRIQEIIQQQGLARSQITILDALLKLRQVCCDPRLVQLPGFADLERPAEASAKLEWLSTVLPELVAEGRRVLLFSQFTSMLRLLEPLLAELSIPYCLLTGETTDRTAVVARFQSGAVPVFLISLKAGGTALNLTAADTVIHYDPWWNPAVEAQATDRAHRIGQTRSVFVYKLIAQGTVEERMLQLQADKRVLAERLYTEKRSSPGALSAADLEMLLAP